MNYQIIALIIIGGLIGFRVFIDLQNDKFTDNDKI